MINHINISKQKELEKAFADDFSSPIFPILGELYLNKKDFIRAKKVCEIGLEHDPENINGYYILSKIHLYNNELHKAQEYLEIIIRKKPLHIKALKLIVKLNEELNVSKKNQLKYLNKLFNIFPNDTTLELKISSLDSKYINKKDIHEEYEKTTTQGHQSKQRNINFNIQPNMATLTFVEILKEQKHYHEALHVLSLLESKSEKKSKTKKLKNELKKLLAELQ